MIFWLAMGLCVISLILGLWSMETGREVFWGWIIVALGMVLLAMLYAEGY